MSTEYTEKETPQSVWTKVSLQIRCTEVPPQHPTNIPGRSEAVDGRELLCSAHFFFTSLELGPGLSVNANCSCSVTTLSSDR